MPWVKFERDFIWTPVRVQSIMYRKGFIALVTTPCANEAIKAGAAKKVQRPANVRNKDQEPRQIEQETD